jgi:tRNA A37 threonylcarbamoyladenosine synthetase subunit TsaC/SUA5/YrdC
LDQSVRQNLFEGLFYKIVTYHLEGGECQSGIESTIVGFEGKCCLYRLGSITVEAIETIVGPLKNKQTQ